MPEKTKEFEVLELPGEETINHKNIRYIVKHAYQNSGKNLMDVLKIQLLKKLEMLDITSVSCHNGDVNIFG